jgi:hypothetical protein
VHLILWPIKADLDYNILDKLRSDISKEFEDINLTLDVHIDLKTPTNFQSSSVNKRRNQWNSFKILE